MPNAPVAASATALPDPIRRSLLQKAGIAVVAATAAAVIPTAAAAMTAREESRPYQSRAFIGDGWYFFKSGTGEPNRIIFAFRDGHELIAMSPGPDHPAESYIGHHMFDRLCVGPVPDRPHKDADVNSVFQRFLALPADRRDAVYACVLILMGDDPVEAGLDPTSANEGRALFEAHFREAAT